MMRSPLRPARAVRLSLIAKSLYIATRRFARGASRCHGAPCIVQYLGVAAGLLLVASPAPATPGVNNYPKTLAFTGGVAQLSESAKDSLSWFDVLICLDRPETIASLRARNPKLRFLWNVSPQFAPAPAGDNPWWIADTLWSAGRLAQYYVEKNNWYMHDTAGELVFNGNGYLVNWTRHCPVGTFGSAKGLRAAEWFASVALPEIALSGRYWQPWSWDSREAYNGFLFEIMADCLGSYGWQFYADCDPDSDGDPDGVYHVCSGGGANDPLTVLMREENEVFYTRLSAAFPDEFVFLINENNKWIGPWWRTRMSGMKFENWMHVTNPDWMAWWDWFYGLTPPWLLGDNWGAGYQWAEDVFDKPAPDSLKGWDLSFIQVWDTPERTPSENLRQMRWGLGTSLLGEGYFCYTIDQHRPHWQPEFDYDFGTPLGPYRKEIIAGSDTLYVRQFSRGMVEVNPYEKYVRGVPWLDSRFTFWLPVADLHAYPLDARRVRVVWTVPHGAVNDADYFELRYSTAPITLENWDAATAYAGNPIVGTPSTPISQIVDGLLPRTRYYFAIRTHTAGRPEPFLSPVISIQTPDLQGNGGITRVDEEEGGNLPESTGITGIAPNPARAEASIGFTVTPRSGPLRLSIHDVSGRLVRTLVEGTAEPGWHARAWDGVDDNGTRAAAGIYFVRMSWSQGSDSETLLLLR